MKEPEDFRKEIDDKFKEAKTRGLSRMNLDWGLWSGEMNRELRIYTETEGPMQVLYKYVFVYWTLKSQLLELLYRYKNRPFGKIKIKRKRKEIKEVIKILDLKVKGRDLSEEEILAMVVKVT